MARGFEGRPAYGFAFTRLAPDGATVTDLAVHLGVTKQAATGAVEEWAELLGGEGEIRALRDRLRRIAPYGPLRPAW